MANPVITAKMLRETLSKVAPYGSIGVSAEELASTLHAPLYKVRYILDSVDWAKFDGKHYTLAEGIRAVPSSDVGKDNSKKGEVGASQEKLKQVMYRVAGSKTKGVSTAYLSFALRCTEAEVLDLISQSDWVEKIGDMYRCKAISEVVKTLSSKISPNEAPSKIDKKTANSQLISRLEHIMSTFAPHSSVGVTKAYLALSLNYPSDRIPELIRQVDWIETVDDRYRMRDISARPAADAAQTEIQAKTNVTETASLKEGSGTINQKSSAQIPNSKMNTFDEYNFSDYIRTPEDGELFSKYPVLLKRVFAVIKNSTEPCSVGRIYDATKRISRIEAVSEILNKASWTRQNGALYTFIPKDGETPAHQSSTLGADLSSASDTPSYRIVDFENIGDLSFTKPVSFQYFEISRMGFRSWKDLYIDFMGCYYEDYPNLFYHGVTFSTKESSRADIADAEEMNILVSPREIPGSTLCAETNFSASDIVGRIKRLLDMGELEYKYLTITYSTKTKQCVQSEPLKESEAKSNSTEDAVYSVSDTSASCVVDFENIGNYYYTKPESYQYFEISRTGFQNWIELYTDFMGCYYEDYPHLLYHGAKFSTNGNAQADIADKDKRDILILPKEILGSALCVETNLEVSDVIHRIKYLLDIGNLDYDNLTITYSSKAEPKSAPKVKKAPAQKAKPAQVVPDEKTDFAEWLRSKGTVESNVKNFVLAIELTESYAKEYGCEHNQFFGTDPMDTKLATKEILANGKFANFNERKSFIFSRALRKFMEFQQERQQRQAAELEKATADENVSVIESAVSEAKTTPDVKNPKPVDEIHALLLDEYANGFRLNSSLEMKKFKKKYEVKYGSLPSMTDEQIDWAIRKCGIVHDNRLYCPEKMLDGETKGKLEKYIKDCFQSGKKCLYFEALFSVFSEQFLDHNIYNGDMLKTYLQSVYRGQYYFFSNYLAIDKNATSDPTEEIRNCMVEYGKPIVYEELYRLLPHIPDEKIRFVLNTTKEFINNGRKQYFHINVFQISEDELDDIAAIIELLIQQNKFISGNELVNAIRIKLPYVLEANSEIADIGIRNALAQLLGSRFSFKGNIISALGVEIEMRDVFSEFSRNTPKFTLDELSKLASDLNTTIYFDYIYENAVRISQNIFVRKDQVAFDISQIDQLLDTFCEGQYIPVRDITNFVAFPDCGYAWNAFLLESFVAEYSKRYCLLHNTYGIKSVSGGIVKRSSGIATMDSLIAVVLADSNCTLKKEPALEHLYDYGYLGMKRYSTIEQVLIDAQTIRNKRGM